MFSEPTVILLGAGASFDFNYPLGWKLVEQVKDLANVTGNTDFGKSLEQMRPFSIDLFLSLFPRYENIGKELIAEVLLSCEQGKNANKINEIFTVENNWYRFLIDSIITGCRNPEDLIKNQLSIITFNYDLSLEYYIYHVLKKNRLF